MIFSYLAGHFLFIKNIHPALQIVLQVFCIEYVDLKCVPCLNIASKRSFKHPVKNTVGTGLLDPQFFGRILYPPNPMVNVGRKHHCKPLLTKKLSSCGVNFYIMHKPLRLM